MLAKLKRHLADVLGWLVRRPGYMLLTAGDERIAAESPSRFAHAWAELLALSIGWGLASVGVWVAVWNLFGEPSGFVMHALAVTAMLLLWPFRRAVTGAVELLFGADPAPRAIAAAVWVLALTTGLLALQRVYRHEVPLHEWIAWIRPWEKLYRVLILTPLWGAWAMLITPQFRRPTSTTDPAIAAFARGCGPLAATAVMGGLLALTIKYFGFLPWEQLSISGVTILTAIVAGAVFCRLDRGLTRRALLAANAVTQLTFLMAYLAAQHLLLW